MIDVDKFLNSVLNYPGNGTLTNTVKMLFTYALSEQNLEFKNGEIQSIGNKPKWYKCIKEYRSFTVGKLYCTNENGDLSSDQDVDCRYVIAIDNPYFKEWFRPATEEEVKEAEIKFEEEPIEKKRYFKDIHIDEDEFRTKVKELLCGGLDDSFWSKEEIDELIQETDEGSKKMMEAMRKIAFAKEPDIYAMALKYQQSHRCSQPKQEWSEEDESIYNAILDTVNKDLGLIGVHRDWFKNIKYRLRSIIPQNRWKPTEEQMKALRAARATFGVDDVVLASLIYDLEKLTE